jgi:hypothetical protein
MKTEKDITVNAKYNVASDWLVPRGYNITFSNHPSSDIREFHFTKDRVRIKVFINEDIYYCTAICQLYSDPVCTLNTGRYMIHNDDIFDAINVLVKSKAKIEGTAKEPKIQVAWETWFVASIVIFLVYFFVGTLENSQVQFPNWLPFMLIACLNLIICMYYGCKPIRK